jgi:uncharacterized protein
MHPAEPRAELTIAITDLDASGKAYAFDLRPEWIRSVLEEHEANTNGKPGTIEGRVSKSGADVILHGHLKADLEAPCARCLNPASFRINKQVSVLFVPASQLRPAKVGKGTEIEFSPEDADTLPYSGESLVLDDFVRDELILETPMIPLCSEDCPGMDAPPAPKDETPEEPAIDPRLLPLLKFKKPS